MYTNNLAATLSMRFERLGGTEDLCRSVEIYENLVKTFPDNSTRAFNLSSLGAALVLRFDRRRLQDDLDRAIRAHEQAIDLTPVNHPERPARINNLANALSSRFARYGEVSDSNKSISLREKVVRISLPNSSKRAMYLCNLGIDLRLRFERTEDFDDLNRSIAVHEESVESVGDGHAERAMFLMNLGSALKVRSEWTGSLQDLNRSISFYHEAVKITKLDHPDYDSHLSNFTGVLHLRFLQTGSSEDIMLAIQLGEDAIQRVSNDHPSRPVLLNNLSISYGSRASRSTKVDSQTNDDMKRAIDLLQEAVDLSPLHDPERIQRLINLSVALASRYDQSGSPEDLTRSVQLIVDAIESLPVDHPKESSCLSNYGTFLLKRYQLTKSVDDLDYSIAMHQASLALTLPTVPFRSMRLQNLGQCLEARFLETKSPKDVANAIRAYEEAASLTTTTPTNRVSAAVRAALLLQNVDVRGASRMLRLAVEILPETSPRFLNRQDQQEILSAFPGLSSLATAFALDSDESPYEALSLLEKGRGVMASHILNTRTDITDLEEQRPELATRFRQCRDQIDSLEISRVNSVETATEQSAHLHRRHVLDEEFRDIIASIRALNGFENFLQGPTESQMKLLAADGPIVVLNVAPTRSDAFIVTKDSIDTITLPNLQHDDLRTKAASLSSAVAASCRPSKYASATREMKGVLSWIWDVVVGPVLDKLGYQEMPQPGAIWPHVWWIATDYLASMPLHAAQKKGYCLDCVISSYAPTIKSIVHARERIKRWKENNRQVEEVMLMSMAETPKLKDLEFVETEIALVDSLIPSSIRRTILQNPNKSNVIDHLRRAQVSHFACHGYSDYRDPSQSKLFL
jgi:tetratricopeptide (TPR) repeat protein